MQTLGTLIREYTATGCIMEDAGQGSATSNGRWVDAEDIQGYLDVTLRPIPAHVGAGGIVCHFASDWIVEGTGDNPYRIRFYF